jgi:hypothetical protein
LIPMTWFFYNLFVKTKIKYSKKKKGRSIQLNNISY